MCSGATSAAPRARAKGPGWAVSRPEPRRYPAAGRQAPAGALDDGNDTHDAVIEAVSTAGRSVLSAGSTVIIAMLGLVFVGLSYMHGVALAASIAVLTVMVAAITLLPALLSFAGHRVDSLRIPLLGRRRARATAGESPALRWSHLVQRHPWRFAIAATAVLLALALP